ncbi:MAG: hypothetical protein IPG13_10635 [Rhodocyclaceae bacterium]|nr:hypothetical protein [Rhodocyclaceae bacterium]
MRTADGHRPWNTPPAWRYADARAELPLAGKAAGTQAHPLNLVDNATRYGDGQAVDIEYDIADSLVEIRVLDRGPGIRKPSAKRYFSRFAASILP